MVGVTLRSGLPACPAGIRTVSRPGQPAECAWADNDTFGVVASPAMNVSQLAAQMRAIRPDVEHVVK